MKSDWTATLKDRSRCSLKTYKYKKMVCIGAVLWYLKNMAYN